jgi:hypothetical protein
MSSESTYCIEKFNPVQVLGRGFSDYDTLKQSTIIQSKNLITKTSISDLGSYVYSDLFDQLVDKNTGSYFGITSLYEENQSNAPKDQTRIVYYEKDCLHTIRLNFDKNNNSQPKYFNQKRILKNGLCFYEQYVKAELGVDYEI